jgi:tetratricopeptide (TPR) repeat protein
LVLTENNKAIFQKEIDIAPDKPFSQKITVTPETDIYNLRLSLLSPDGKELIFYQPIKKKEGLPLPEIVSPPAEPKDIATVEELYLTGLRIRQFHNARLHPIDYFLEGLKRDSLDTRCNNEIGLYHKQKGEYEIAAGYFRKAIYRLAKDYTRPLTCEPFYHLGLVLKAQGKLADAYDTLYRAAWDQACSSAAYFNLAQISCKNQDFSMAYEEINKSVAYNNSNLNARKLKSNILRHLGVKEEALAEAAEVLSVDPLNFMAANEKYLLSHDESELAALKSMMRDAPESYLELAVAYVNTGLFPEATDLLSRASTSTNAALANYPTIHYYLGYLSHLVGNESDARQSFEKAGSLPVDYCFPFRLESENVYQTALTYNPQDANVWYYLGNLLYDKQPARAMACWQQAVKSNENFAMAYRNLGLGYNQTSNDLPKAISAYESAIASTLKYPVFFYELDKLYERAGTSLDKRYNLMVKNHDHLKIRKDALLQEIKVLIL